MRMSKICHALTLALLAATCASTPLRAENNEKPKVRVAPAPDLGTGALSILVLVAGGIIAARRKR